MMKKSDPIVMEVINNRLQSIANEMEDSLLKMAFSVIVKEMKDASTAIFDAKGRTIAQSAAMPCQLGFLSSSVPAILEDFPVSQAKEGDVYLQNDPFNGGSHIPDVTALTPIFYEGEVVAFAASMVHLADTGGIAPGVSTAATCVYQEGLCLPPVKFYDEGKPVKDIHEIIKQNVRIPDEVMGDLEAQVACGKVGIGRIQTLCDEYGKDVFLDTVEGLLDHSEALTRQALEEIPDGTYTFTGYIDNDGVEFDKQITLKLSVTIKGSDILFDFTGSSPQTKGPINCVKASTLSTIEYAVKVVTGGDSIPTNDGCFRMIQSILPEGSIVNAVKPAPTGSRGLTVQLLSSICLGALAKAKPEMVNACSGAYAPLLYIGGYNPATQKSFVSNDNGMCGLGARPGKDGIDAISSDSQNVLAIPVEAFEMSGPLRVLKYGLADNSGGAGKYRGGLGSCKVIRLLDGEVSFTFRGDGFFVPPWGLFGGGAAKVGTGYIKRKNGDIIQIPSKGDYVLYAGDEIGYESAGGGGYGDPLERAPELVLQDVLDERVSYETAEQVYGVSIDRKTNTVDDAVTIVTRDDLRLKRGPIAWTYDRGILGKE